MQEIQIFNNAEFGSVRTLEVNGEPYFVGKDVAIILNYKDTADAIQRHVDEDDKVKHPLTDNLGRTQEMAVINESGLYSLILSSKLPTAKKFKHWVTSEVLPSIHKHGAYMTPQVIEQTLTNPDFLIQLAELGASICRACVRLVKKSEDPNYGLSRLKHMEIIV